MAVLYSILLLLLFCGTRILGGSSDPEADIVREDENDLSSPRKSAAPLSDKISCANLFDEASGKEYIRCSIIALKDSSGMVPPVLLEDCVDQEEDEFEVCVTATVELSSRTPKSKGKVDTALPEENPERNRIISETESSSETATATTTEEKSRLPSTEIVVGDMTYIAPWNSAKYTPAVSQVLMQHDYILMESDSNQVGLATWYIDLGLALRHALEDGEDQHSTEETTDSHVNSAMTAFRQADQLLKGLEQTQQEAGNRRELLRTAITRASLYLHMGETYTFSQTLGHLATEYYLQAHRLYEEHLGAGYDDDSEKFLGKFDFLEAQLAWALVCQRFGVSLLSSKSDYELSPDMIAALLHQEGYSKAQQRELEESQRLLLGKITKAEGFFMFAHDLYARMIDDATEAKNTWDLPNYQRQLAATQQNLGTAASMKGDLRTSVQYAEGALELYKTAMSGSSTNEQDTIAAVGEAMMSLADSYLQLAEYDLSSNMYDECMEWHSKYDMEPTGKIPMLESESDPDFSLVDEYEELLEEYELTFDEDSGFVDRSDGDGSFYDELSGEYMYQKDDGYEADLHSTLGALYVAQDDIATATMHLSEAVRLYHTSGDASDRPMADVKFNLALAHYRNGSFRESAKTRRDALVIYQKVVVEGENPLLEGLPVDVLGFSTSFSNDAVPKSRTTLGRRSKDKRASSSDTAQEESGKIPKTRIEAVQHKPRIHEDLIDLASFQEQAENATLHDEL